MNRLSLKISLAVAILFAHSHNARSQGTLQEQLSQNNEQRILLKNTLKKNVNRLTYLKNEVTLLSSRTTHDWMTNVIFLIRSIAGITFGTFAYNAIAHKLFPKPDVAALTEWSNKLAYAITEKKEEYRATVLAEEQENDVTKKAVLNAKRKVLENEFTEINNQLKKGYAALDTYQEQQESRWHQFIKFNLWFSCTLITLFSTNKLIKAVAARYPQHFPLDADEKALFASYNNEVKSLEQFNKNVNSELLMLSHERNLLQQQLRAGDANRITGSAKTSHEESVMSLPSFFDNLL